MKLLNLSQIEDIVTAASKEELIQCIESAFIALSDGSATVPPVGHLGFTDPPGDVHIKYGFIKGNPYYVIKIASGFYQNQLQGLPNNNGMMLVFNAKTGESECMLQDEGYLTELRTALAGAVVSKHLAPKVIKAIGIIGTGIQARMQLELLSWVTDCKTVYAYGRSSEKLAQFCEEMIEKGFDVNSCDSSAEVAQSCNLIVTTTASQEALLSAEDINPGTHITAMGADAPGKRELSSDLLAKADLIACDSKEQCIDHGEVYHALKDGLIEESSLVEIGELISKSVDRSPDAITVADLTGIATQDIMIASFVLAHR